MSTAGQMPHAMAASALMLVYVAVMSGHMTSMDGFLLQRQAPQQGHPPRVIRRARGLLLRVSQVLVRERLERIAVVEAIGIR